MLTFIVNPVAGNGFAQKIEEQLKSAMAANGLECRFVQTKHPGHATEIARACAAEADCTGVVAVGGDGTAYEIACGLMNSGTPLGIIPAGTGNDFIKTIGVPKRPLDALKFLLSHSPRPVDAGGLNGRIFLNDCGTGFDVTVLDYTLAAKKHFRGLLPYLIGLVQAILHYRPVHVRFSVDGHTEERDLLTLSVANGRFIGGGIPICPIAQADDGLLDLVIVEDKPRWMLPFLVPSLLMGRILHFPFAKHQRCKAVEVFSEGMRMNVDGEILEMDSAAFSIQPGALLLFW